LHNPIELFILNAGHNLQMHIPIVLVALTNNLSSGNDPILRRHAALDDARRKENPVRLT
jgi:hypothetical protein